MDTDKIKQLASLLLDTGKRNNLVSFRDTKASTVEVVIPSADELFSQAESTASFVVYDPKIDDDEDEDYRDHKTSEEEGANSIKPARLNREDYINTYSPKIKKGHQILLYNANVNPVNALKNIDKKAREQMEETGNNVAYMAFGFIHWKESESSQMLYRAPILLAPIEFRNDSAISPWYINMTEDDIIVNPTFAYKIQAEQGISLPDFQDESFSEYLSKVESTVRKIGWSVSNECKIGLFSFLKMNMYMDLVNNQNDILQNNNIRMLLGEPFDLGRMELGEQEYNLKNPLIELHNVVDADSSQIEAIEMAKAGISFVLQGPPGTGKSQTITNMIAECLNDGKKVLFVSEKQAALNVVFDKLKKAGLEEFCLELHSHKANKKEVINNLCKTLRIAKTIVIDDANQVVSVKQKCQQALDSYETELHKNREGIERSLYQLYNDYASCHSPYEVSYLIPDIEKKGIEYLKTATDLLEQYVEFIPSVGYQYKENPWYGYNNDDTSYQVFTKVKDDVIGVNNALGELLRIRDYSSERYGVNMGSLTKIVKAMKLFLIAAKSNILTPVFYNTEHLTYLRDQLGRMGELGKQILSIEIEINKDFDKEIYSLDAKDYNKRLTRQFNGFLSRTLNQEYKRIISDLRYYNKTGKNISYDEAVEITKRLSLHQDCVEEFASIEKLVKTSLGTDYAGYDSDWDNIDKEVQYLDGILNEIGSLDIMSAMSNADYQSCRKEFEAVSGSISKILNSSKDAIINVASCFDKKVFDLYNADINISISKMTACVNEVDKLENWVRFQSICNKLYDIEIDKFIDAAIEMDIPAQDIINTYKKCFYEQWIDYIIHSSEELVIFSRIKHDQLVKDFTKEDISQFEVSKARIRSELSSKRPSLDMIAAGSELSLLLREGEKKRKQLSVRKLLEAVGTLIQTIKPCFLMSPLSVSTFLTSKNVRFDVVIFDEASQVFPQDAIGAIYRAHQLIVVGDSKQMPPSNFFTTMSETDDRDEETGDITDYESILDICAASLKQRRLRWHYRSRFEELIAFSNKNFYDNDLTTFPSATSNKQWVGIDFYHVEDGVFDRTSKTNRKEAEYIVDLVFENIEKFPNRSLGVVAFSIAQQDLIDRLISRRRVEDPSKEEFFRRDMEEPFFVKNLETVQGDERDTIIFSVAYAKDSTGRFLHNFGPLNRQGGEKRLNVAITRAKMNVQLISSIRYTDIDLSRTNSEGATLLREYLDYAENGHIALERTVFLNQYEQFESPFEEDVCDFLRNKGYEVDTQVGCSNFRIDLGLKRPDTSDYVLAIECDGATYHSSKNARDRDRLRQEVLENMGWKFYRIWSTDWFRNTAVEKERLLIAVKDALDNETTSATSDIDTPKTMDARKPVPIIENEFEERVGNAHLAFPVYRLAHVSLDTADPYTVKSFIKPILEVEAPLSEEWLLKRIVRVFGRAKVTSVVQEQYKYSMLGCENIGIVRRNGFLYLKDHHSYTMRVPGSDKRTRRDIKYIAPEELAAGMHVIIEQNVSIGKDGLYHLLAKELGFQRLTENMILAFDEALYLLNDLSESNGSISLKKQ